MAKIISITKNSPLYGKIAVGEQLIKFDDRDFVDILDYIYADSQTNGAITVKNERGERVVSYQKSDEYQSLGLEFDDTTDITPRECNNNCIFCFVKQLPDNLRETLYIKDDDYRLSFVSGSYITCTNISERDIERIINYQLSPLYVSVHATQQSVRNFMLGIKKSRDILSVMTTLITNGITLHAQIVLVGGVNDGQVLKKSLADMQSIGVSSVAVVPVGLTSFRENLHKIMPLNREQARDVISITEDFYGKYPYFCYCSDEMYQIAEWEVKDVDYYGNFDQIENGVGLIASFLAEVQEEIANCHKNTKKSVGVLTGVSGESTICRAKEMIKNAYPNIEINIYPVKNSFFGETVTVTGLVTASDIIKNYGSHKFTEKYLMIPSVMLREFQDVFLDGMTTKQLSKALKKKIKVVSPTGQGFVKGLLGRKHD